MSRTLVPRVHRYTIASALVCTLFATASVRATESAAISVNWDDTLTVSKTTPSMQVIPNAWMERGHRLHGISSIAIKKLDTQYVRYLPWGPYPRLQIAQLRPPTTKDAFWDFSHIDPEFLEFLESTKGRQPVVNFSSVPNWMFTDPAPVYYAADADTMDWGCGNGSDNTGKPPHLQDPTGKQLADYYARIVSWYTQGGFVDENGKYHASGYKYELPWWGVLNEFDFLGPQQYTIVYDAIVSAIRKLSPKTRFVALEAGGTEFPGEANPDFFEYFLDSRNHQTGIPLDMIAYHFYAFPAKSETIANWQYTFFDQADEFLAQVKFIESIRKRLSPSTLVYLDELGSTLPADVNVCGTNGASDPEIPAAYWNLSAALFAYLYTELAKQGIDVVGQAGFLFYPGNYPSVSMVNWKTGQLNARFHVLQLIENNFGPGDKLVYTSVGHFPFLEDVAAQAFETARGKKLLLINKRAYATDIQLDALGKINRIKVVDERSGEGPARSEAVRGKNLHLEPFAVAVLSIQ